YNDPSNVPAVPGFENIVGAFVYPGGNPNISTNDLSPRLGATFALTKDGKTLIRGNYARYYDAFDLSFVAHSNPTATYNGATFSYVNKNGDRTITQDELIGDPQYYGGLNGPNFDLDAFLSKRVYDPNLSNGRTNEVVVGIEHEIAKDFSVSANFSY